VFLRGKKPFFLLPLPIVVFVWSGESSNILVAAEALHRLYPSTSEGRSISGAIVPSNRLFLYKRGTPTNLPLFSLKPTGIVVLTGC